MSYSFRLEQPLVLNAAIFDYRPGSVVAPIPVRMLLTDGRYREEVTSWSPPMGFAESTEVHLGVATLIGTGPEDSEELLLLDWKPDRRLEVLSFVPEYFCPVEGTVAQVRTLVALIEEPALRDFVMDVFLMKDVFRHFWTCPASIANHHAEPGGLAVHSLEVATAVAQLRSFRPNDLWIAMVYALFHDIGKIWSYEKGTLTVDAMELGHEHIGFERLLPALRRLREKLPDDGLVLHGLFAGGGYRDDKRRGRAIGKVVRSLDAFSAEKYMERKPRRLR